MCETKICHVMNQVDKEMIIMCSEWSEYNFKVFILSNDSISFSGEMETAAIDKFAEGLHKTRAEYIEDTKKIISGLNTSVQFIFKENTLQWRRKMWRLGEIQMRADSITALTEKYKKSLHRQEYLEKSLASIQTENKELRSTVVRSTDFLNQITKEKCEMEALLYSKFLVILNSKKQKIRELTDKLKSLDDTRIEESLYEVQTDESETSETEHPGKHKRKLADHVSESVSKRTSLGTNMSRAKLSKTQFVENLKEISDSDSDDFTFQSS